MDNKLKELITKYNIRLTLSNNLALNKKPKVTDLQFIKENKDSFVTFIQKAEMQKEKEEKEENEVIISIIVDGRYCEETLIAIDLRQDVETQLKKYVGRYTDDYTEDKRELAKKELEYLREEFKEALAKKEVERGRAINYDDLDITHYYR